MRKHEATAGLIVLLLSGGSLPLRAAEAGASSEGGNALEAVVAQAVPRVVKIYGAGIGRTRDFGSGVLVSADGKVVTVLSLMLDATNLRVVTADGTRYRATVVRRDDARQLALLQLDLKAVHGEAAPPLPFFTASRSDRVEPGDWVAAVANPFKVATGDEPVSVQLGVLSGVVMLMLPVLALLFVLFEVLASAVYAASRNTVVPALVESAWLAWIFAAVLPISV